MGQGRLLRCVTHPEVNVRQVRDEGERVVLLCLDDDLEVDERHCGAEEG